MQDGDLCQGFCSFQVVFVLIATEYLHYICYNVMIKERM